jgi:hypothetical protein
VPKSEIVLLKGETVMHVAETVVPEAVPEAANVAPEANVTMMDSDAATMVLEADVSLNSDEKNQCVRCKGKMHRDYLCIGCDCPIHWFCADGDSTDNETRGTGRSIGVLHAFQQTE